MPEISSFGRWIFILGVVMIFIGGIIWFLGRTGIPLGRLPGDLRFQFGSLSCFVPLLSSLILSVLLTIILNMIMRLLNK